MKNRFLIEPPMTVEAAKELIDYFNFVNKTVRGLMAWIEGTDLGKSPDAYNNIGMRINGKVFKTSELEFINKKNGFHFFIDEYGLPCILASHLRTKGVATYPEKEVEETETNENEIAQNFVDDFEDTLSEHINRLLGDYKEIEDSVRSTVKDFCEGISKKETNEEDKSSTSDTKCNSVVHPNHYNSGKYECIEVMKEVFGDEAVKLFCVMNTFKYLWRYNKKNGEEDVAKAYNYLKIRSGLNKTEE